MSFFTHHVQVFRRGRMNALERKMEVMVARFITRMMTTRGLARIHYYSTVGIFVLHNFA